MILRKDAGETLVGIEMNRGDALEYKLSTGKTFRMELIGTHAEIFHTTLTELRKEESGARTNYRFTCDLKVNGQPVTLEREVSSQRSFYDPWELDGVDLWFDAVDDIFSFINETHGDCCPAKHARFALQETGRRICPEKLHPWCPLPEGGLKIEECYRGEDCWLGAYNGASAHGGLDINHPPGTPLWAPLDIHDHFYFNSLELGHNNNRWRGIHRWHDGSEWILQAHHMTELLLPEHVSIEKGTQFANGAGVLSGAADHSHFVFKIREDDETILLDPWILFQQMYRDQGDS